MKYHLIAMHAKLDRVKFKQVIEDLVESPRLHQMLDTDAMTAPRLTAPTTLSQDSPIGDKNQPRKPFLSICLVA